MAKRKKRTVAKRRNAWPLGKWIKTTAVRIRKEAGRLVMDKR